MHEEALSKGGTYQSSSDIEPVKGGMDRTSDQASRMTPNYQMGGADEINELGTRGIRPPYSNPANGEMQSTGADQVEELRSAHNRDDFAWEDHAGGGRKAPQATD
jgi:hypothetical protein